MDGLFTNRNAAGGDFHCKAFVEHGREVVSVDAAVAFLTQAQPLIDLADSGVLVRVIVRLGYPTAPRALADLLKHPKVMVHATSSTAFHPKLYLFEGRCALVGSANMTDAALMSNQEISVEVPAGDPRYQELSELFDAWWDASVVLDEQLLKQYRTAYAVHSPLAKVRALEKAIEGLAPGHLSDVDVTQRKKPTHLAKDIDAYQRTYEQFLASFAMLREAYADSGVRALPELPLRLEIDAFLGWLREAHAGGDTPETAERRSGAGFVTHLLPFVREWDDGHAQRWGAATHLEARLAQFQSVLGTPESIEAATQRELIEALLNAHSVGDRLRFYKGGRPTQLANMIERMPEARLKATLTYLLHGEGSFIERMARCIRDPEWRLDELGRSGVQEVFGWVNGDDVPICNERTLKSMRWLGLTVRILA